MTLKEQIVTSAFDLFGANGVYETSVSEVAALAGCAKGLVNYHFGSKARLVEAIALGLIDRREKSWREAISGTQPHAAILNSWALLLAESENGTVRAWRECVEGNNKLTEQPVNTIQQRFASVLGDSAIQVLSTAGMKPRVESRELGLILAATVNGMGGMLSDGVEAELLEGAYEAAWLGVL